MKNLLGRLSLGSRSLRPQLGVAFALMSILPILLLLGFVFPSLLSAEARPVVLILVALFAVAGFLLMKRVIDSVIRISQGVRSLASGEVSAEIACPRKDELGELSSSLNQLASHIKNNMDELKVYGERTRNINSQINRQLVALGGLLEISNMVTAGAQLQEIFAAAITKVALFANARFAFLMMKELHGYVLNGQHGLKGSIVESLGLPANQQFLDYLLQGPGVLLSADAPLPPEAAEALKLLEAAHLLTCPIMVCGEPRGFVAVGNAQGDATFGEEDAELIGVFAKQMSLAVENNFLSDKIKEIEISDSVSGLYNKRYLVQRLDEEILRSISNQRPCAFIVFQVTNWRDMAASAAPATARLIAEILKKEARCFDCLGRLSEDVYGIIVPEKNKRQAEQFGRQILDKLVASLEAHGAALKPALRMAVAENPIDGADAAGLMETVRATIAV
ncbi:MAG: diguanylate cyclase domain-containing protein [Deltaproteobacteria bacterium]